MRRGRYTPLPDPLGSLPESFEGKTRNRKSGNNVPGIIREFAPKETPG